MDCKAQAQKPGKVLENSFTYLDLGLNILDPFNRDFKYPVMIMFCQKQELGIKKPVVVLDERDKSFCHVSPHRLKAALRIGKSIEE